jgi:hypothetical protein
MTASSVGCTWLVASELVCSGLLDRDGFRDTTVSPHPAQEVMKDDRRTLLHACRRMEMELVPSLANKLSQMSFYMALAVTASMYGYPKHGNGTCRRRDTELAGAVLGPKLHARLTEPWLRHRYARFDDTTLFPAVLFFIRVRSTIWLSKYINTHGTRHLPLPGLALLSCTLRPAGFVKLVSK